MEPGGLETLTLREMFARREDPYEGADLPTSRRVVAAMLALSTLLTAAFLPLDPPSARIGWPGWVVGGALVVAGALAVRRLADRSRPVGFGPLLVVAYIGLAQVVALQWLGGGAPSVYGVLFLAWIAAGAVHPPRQAFPHLTALIAAVLLPLTYGSYDARTVGNALLLIAVGTVLIGYLHTVRRQRVDMQAGVEVQRKLARVDELTGLGNRRAFDEALTIDVAMAERQDFKLSVGLIDLDGLKRINDGYGHLEGDRCLRDLGRALEEASRTSDRCFRWAGDEFAVLLPGTDRRSALAVLDRVADFVRARCRRPDGTPLEISYGAGQLVPASTPEELLEMADVDLLSQKDGKRG